jgi:hypothetical protein
MGLGRAADYGSTFYTSGDWSGLKFPSPNRRRHFSKPTSLEEMMFVRAIGSGTIRF